MEFKLLNPTEESGFIQNIEFNFEELKTELTNRLEKYKNLTYTEDNIKDAKADKAGLNKFREAIETRRKEIKKLCLQPYNDFEIKVKELVELVDEPIAEINKQLQTFEEQKTKKKKKEIEEYFNSKIGDLKGLLPFERVLNQKWLNATFSIKNVQTEINQQIDFVNASLRSINSLKLESDIELQVKDKFLLTLDFNQALQEKERLRNLKKTIAEQEKTTAVQFPQQLEQQPKTTEPEKIYIRKFQVRGTKTQLIALSNFMKNNGIEYGGIE